MSRPVIKGLCALLAVGFLLGACGKKSNLAAPEGQEDAYSYPRIYPSVLNQPAGAIPVQPPEETDPRQRPLSPFPFSRTSPTKTYGSS